MDAEGVVSRYYRLITLTPRGRAASLLVLGLLVILSSVATSLPTNEAYAYLRGLATYSLEASILVALLLPLGRTRIFNIKRSMNFAAAIMLATLPAEVILSMLGGPRGLGISASPGFSVFVLAGFYRVRAAALLSLYPAVLVPLIDSPLLGYEMPHVAPLVILMSFTSLGMGASALYSIEYLGRRRKVSPLDSVRAFMRAWLIGNHESLEELIRSLGVSGRVRVRALVFKRELGEPVALVFPDFHFGPFRNVGSARFIYSLEEGLRPAMESLVFHTPGSHERNIAMASRSLEIAKSAASSISSYYGQLVDYGMCKPLILRKGEWEVYVLRGPTAVVSFLTNVVRGNDDLPYSIWEEAERLLGGDPLLNLLAIVDSHAAKGPPFEDDEELVHVISTLKGVNRCSEEEFYVGYGEVVGTGCRELCYDKVRVLSLRFGDERYAIVYLYGNNVDIKTRENIVDITKSMGYRGSLVVTPDDHSCAASFKEKPYHVVSGCPGLYEAISRAAERALEDESRSRYVTLEHVFDGVELAGQNIWRLTSLIDELGRAALRALLLVITLINLVPAPIFLGLWSPW